MADLVVSSAVDTLMGSADQAAIRTNVGGLAAVAPGTGVATALAVATNAGGGVIALADPGADRIVFWDDSAGIFTHLTLGTNLSITGTTINASGGGGGGDVSGPGSSTDTGLAFWNGTGGDTLASSTILLTGGNDLAGIGSLSATDADFSTLTLGAVQLTATFTELNFVDGVTSAIQTQLGTKVTGPASATDNAVVRFDLTTGKLVQDSLVTIADTTGNISTPGSLSCGVGGSVAGTVTLTEGSAPSLTANSFQIYAPADVAAGGLAYITPAAGATGFVLATNAAGVMTLSHVAPTGSGSVVLATSAALTTPAIAGATITSNQNIAAVPAADHSANGPTTSIFNLGATIALMDLVYLGSSSKWLLTDADAASTSQGMLGICLDGGVDTDTTTVALSGSFVRDDTWNWTPGAILYIDTATPGAIVATAPSGTDDVVRVVGWAVTADVIYFSPSPDFITHT